jgi:dephospho-CoA kinase
MYSKPTKSFVKHLKDNNLLGSAKERKIDKKLIREEIFNNKSKKNKLEKFIHKEVKKSRDNFLKKQRAKKTKLVILDIPLLFEAKLEQVCHYIILLYLPRGLQIQRALNRRGMKKDVLLKIIKNQLSDAYKKKKADLIINTSKTKNHSFKMILGAISNIIKSHA